MRRNLGLKGDQIAYESLLLTKGSYSKTRNYTQNNPENTMNNISVWIVW